MAFITRQLYGRNSSLERPPGCVLGHMCTLVEAVLETVGGRGADTPHFCPAHGLRQNGFSILGIQMYFFLFF